MPLATQNHYAHHRVYTRDHYMCGQSRHKIDPVRFVAVVAKQLYSKLGHEREDNKCKVSNWQGN